VKKGIVIIVFLLFSLFAFAGWVIGIGGVYQSANGFFGGANTYTLSFYDDYNDSYYITFDQMQSITIDKTVPIVLNYGFRGENWSLMLYTLSLPNASSYNELCIGWGKTLEFGVDFKSADFNVSQDKKLPISSNYHFSYAIINGHIFENENTMVSRESECEIAYFGAYLRYNFYPFWAKLSYTPFKFHSTSSRGIFMSDDEKTIYFTGTEDTISPVSITLSSLSFSAGAEYEF
jgi:hypothetical protein